MKKKIKKKSSWLELPNSGMASLTCGSVSATRFKNTVSDRRIVTPEKEFLKRNFCLETSFSNFRRNYFSFVLKFFDDTNNVSTALQFLMCRTLSSSIRLIFRVVTVEKYR